MVARKSPSAGVSIGARAVRAHLVDAERNLPIELVRVKEADARRGPNV